MNICEMKYHILDILDMVVEWVDAYIQTPIVSRTWTYKRLKRELSDIESNSRDYTEGLELQVNDLLETNKSLHKQLLRAGKKS